MPPTTFKKSGRVVITIMSKAHGAGLALALRQFCAFSLARNSRTHAAACAAIIAHGLAEDAAEADSLIYEAEELDAQGLLNV